jgi:4-hydroxybenzoate polyprenyltransferase
MCYSVFLLGFIVTGIILKFNYIYFMLLVLIFYQLFFKQINRLDINVTKTCLGIFKSNNQVGLMIFVSIILGKITL